MAAREGPRRQRQARRPREHPGRRRPGRSTATSARSSSSSARPTSSPAASSSRPRPTTLAKLVVAKGEDAVAERAGRARRPQDHAQGEHRARRGRALRGRRRQRARQLPAHAGRPRRQRRARRAGRRARRSWPTTSPCTSPSPGRSTSAATRCRPTWSTHERQTLETITRNEGKPEAALPKIVEGRLNGFFKDVALLDQPYAKDDKQSITQVHRRRDDRPLRPGRDRLSGGMTSAASPRWKRIVFKLSGEAFAGRRGSRPRRGDARRRPRSEIIDVRENSTSTSRVVVGGGNIWRGRTGADVGHGRHAGRPHRHARHGDERARPAGRARARRPGHPGADARSRCRGSPSRTSAAGRCATSRRAGS